jgi:hypothetical protein
MTDSPRKSPSAWDSDTAPVVLQRPPAAVGAREDQRIKDDEEEDYPQAMVNVEFKKDQEAQSDYDSRASLITNSFTRRLLKLGIEELGVHPIPIKDRTDTGFYQVFTLWVAMSVGVIP